MLLTGVFNCIGAFCDGNNANMKAVLARNFRGKILQYLSQPELPQLGVELTRSLAQTLSFLCGHCSHFSDELESVFDAESDMSAVLSVVYPIAKRLNAAAAPDEATLIHLVTILGIILSLLDFSIVRDQCHIVVNELCVAVTRNWQHIDALKVAFCIMLKIASFETHHS